MILPAAALGMAVSLAACGQKDTTTADVAASGTTSAPSAASPPDAAMRNMKMPADTKQARGVGTVTAVDAAHGTITLDHQPIPEANWPAMTMTFKAPAAVTESAKVGESVDFDVVLRGGAGEVTAIRKR